MSYVYTLRTGTNCKKPQKEDSYDASKYHYWLHIINSAERQTPTGIDVYAGI
jgi:hypothetical protein